MIKIAIVEDVCEDSLQLQEYLHQYEKENGENFEITLFSDGDEIVHKYKPVYDIILMDIELKFMDGMTAAEEIRKLDTEVVIMFVTNTPQYAIRGYEVDAFDYVLKPVSYFAFSQRLSRALSRMKKRESKMLAINLKGGVFRLDVSNIFYIESRGHDIIFYTSSGEYVTSGTMRDIEEKMVPMNFFRGNKGYLINLAHVDGVKDNCAIVKGKQLVLSRARRKDFMESLAAYWGEVIK